MASRIILSTCWRVFPESSGGRSRGLLPDEPRREQRSSTVFQPSATSSAPGETRTKSLLVSLRKAAPLDNLRCLPPVCGGGTNWAMNDKSEKLSLEPQNPVFLPVGHGSRLLSGRRGLAAVHETEAVAALLQLMVCGRLRWKCNSAQHGGLRDRVSSCCIPSQTRALLPRRRSSRGRGAARWHWAATAKSGSSGRAAPAAAVRRLGVLAGTKGSRPESSPSER
jgi:hypothetical protein